MEDKMSNFVYQLILFRSPLGETNNNEEKELQLTVANILHLVDYGAA